MRVESAALSLTSTHFAAVRREHTEAVRARVGTETGDVEGLQTSGLDGTPGVPDTSALATRALRDTAERIAAATRAREAQAAEQQGAAAAPDGAGGDSGDRAHVAIAHALLGQVTGPDVRIRLGSGHGEHHDAAGGHGDHGDHGDHGPQVAAPLPPPARAATWSVQYSAHDAVHDTEQTAVAVSGHVVTTDGARFTVSLEATLNREFHSATDVSVQASCRLPQEPLVIQLDRPASSVAEGRFAFDLEGGGDAVVVPTLAVGSGFLVIDRTAPGPVENGRASELEARGAERVGPSAVGGFAELQRHDADGNGWIDEADPVFDRLHVWQPAADGSALQSLEQAGVGAIGLAAVSSPFQFRDGANGAIGSLTRTGLYLSDDTRAGLILEIDLLA